MSLSTPQRIAIFSVLALAMVATRFHHFAIVPDASWAMFFVAGFYLRGSARWAFPLLMALAVAVDIAVISGQGMNFWTHYCVSPAYWMLLPAYAALWFGGAWLRSRYNGLTLASLGRLAAALLVTTTLCYLISNGSFYWLSPVVGERSVAGWFKNLGDWYFSFLGTTVAYVGIAGVFHVIASLALPAPVRATR